jgi:ribosome recycling factor
VGDRVRTLYIRVADALQVATAISNAIRDAGLNLNPAVEGNVIRVPVPKPSKESRDANLKLVSKVAESAKVNIRRIRQEALDKLKKMEGAWQQAGRQQGGGGCRRSTGIKWVSKRGSKRH